MSVDDEGASGHEQVGSLGEEAVRLMAALSGWASHASGGLGHGIEDVAGQVRDGVTHAVRDLDEHLSTGAPECTVCPVCRSVHVLRTVSPEVRSHLASAASSLMHAAAGLLATVTPHEHPGDGAPSRSAGPPVEHIDLDADPGEDV